MHKDYDVLNESCYHCGQEEAWDGELKDYGPLMAHPACQAAHK